MYLSTTTIIYEPLAACAGLHPKRMKDSVQAPEQAFNQSRVMFFQLTGRRSPDIVLVASCMWCARPTSLLQRAQTLSLALDLCTVGSAQSEPADSWPASISQKTFGTCMAGTNMTSRLPTF